MKLRPVMRGPEPPAYPPPRTSSVQRNSDKIDLAIVDLPIVWYYAQ